MTLERQYGKIYFICDECEDELETETENFQEAVAVLNSAGWTAVNVDDEWHHICENCE